MSAIPLGRLFTADRDPTAPVAIRDDSPLSLGGFAADVARTAAIVRASGVARGAVLSADPYRFLVGLFGLLHARATAVVLPDGMQATLADASGWFDTLLCDPPVSQERAALPIQDGGGHADPVSALDPAAATLEFFTSGSSGAAKRIVKPLASLDREIATLHGLWGGSSGGGATLATVPYRHIFGLTFHLLWPLACRRPFVSHVDALWESLLARDTADAVLVTSPAHLTRLSGLAPLATARRPARVFTAGAPLGAAQARMTAQMLGVLPTEIFGSTETGAIATRTQRADAEPWTPLPGVAVCADAEGRMIVRSPFGPEGAPFVSTDRIECAGNGTFHFLERLDRIAKIAGKRVSLARVETALAALPTVRDVAATVLPGASERLAAAVVLTGDGRAQLAELGNFRFSRELRRQLAQQFEAAWLPKSWRFVDTLPCTALGKRRDAEVKALFMPSCPP